ncbi:MAG TPA: SOS response-associated peptidase [Chloroflexota bacterium]|nr:SOS response-associated peptidase [Chloroflexota bacterium]
MCGRYGLDEAEFSESRFEATLLPDVQRDEILVPRYNIAPTQPVLAVAPSKRLGGRRGIRSMRWGLTPSWALQDRSKPRSFNIRTEGILDRPAYRKLLCFNRCAIPANFFYEWRHHTGKTGQPYAIGLSSGELFAFAGIWVAAKDGEGWLVSCAILTSAPNPLVASLHDRQPIILRREDERIWLDATATDPAELMPLLGVLPEAAMSMYPVASLVNNVANEGPELRRRVEALPVPMALL